MVGKADRSQRAARRHLEEGDADFAIGRAYYAVFYLLEALLLTKGLTFSRHSAVIAAFNEHFVKPGVFPAHVSKTISSLFRDRQIGDYEFSTVLSQADGEGHLRTAEELITLLEQWLAAGGFVDT